MSTVTAEGTTTENAAGTTGVATEDISRMDTKLDK